MDAKVQWKISPKVEQLIDTIVECKKQLVDIVKKRNPYNRQLKTIQCEVFASPKLVQLLNASDLWRDCSETNEEQKQRYPYYVHRTSKLVADFELFKLSEDEIVGDEAIRLIMAFSVSGQEGDVEAFIGNVELVS
jgi:hypothetical protein